MSKYEQYVIDAGTLLKAVFAWIKDRSCGSSNFRDHVNNISFIGTSVCGMYVADVITYRSIVSQ